MPYHATAASARTRAGRLAPNTPKLARASTGYGTPYRCPARPINWAPTQVRQNPTNRATTTSHAGSPISSNPAPNVYWAMLWTKANHTEVMLNGPHFRSVLGARSSFDRLSLAMVLSVESLRGG